MPQYDYFRQQFQPGQGETVEIPDEAIGVTIKTWGDPDGDGAVFVRYLVPVEEDA